jgi:signal transduction histidine kinase
MRLGTRLTLAFLVVALVPAGTILTLTWTTAESRFESEAQDRLQGVATGLRNELDRMGRRLAAKVQALAETEEVERILVQMVRGELDRHSLIPLAGKWMRAWELDLLTILDRHGRVLSCGHLPARYGGRDPDLLALATAVEPAPRIHSVRISREGLIRDQLAVLVGTARRFEEAEVAVVGGRLLDERFVEQLETLSGASVAIVDAEDRIIAAGGSRGSNGEAHSLAPVDDGLRERMPLVLGDQAPEGDLKIVVDLSRERLQAVRRGIVFGAATAAAFGVLVSWLLGLLLSRRITRPVQELVEGARHVANGNLSHRLSEEYSAEMGELVQTFNGMVGQLHDSQRRLIRAERVAAWREIARRIAHEIKNPLSPIQVSIETMRKAYRTGHSDFEEIFEESTQAILEEVAALRRTVTEFSDFARLPKPTLEIQRLEPIIERAVALYRSRREGVTFEVTIPDELPAVAVDRELFGQVLSNLLANALQAVAECGHVEVRVDHSGSWLRVRITDDGCGMEPTVLDRVFTPYYTTRRDGTGLGLAIVQRIVEEHEGRIEIESEPGTGTAVSIDLPAAGD